MDNKDFSQLDLIEIVDLGTTDSINVENIDEIGVAHKMMHSLEHNIVKMTILIKLIDKNEKEVGLSKYDFVFKVSNLSDFYERQGSKIKFDAILATILIGISYSTLRGILLQYWKRLNFILPIIDPKEILGHKIEENVG